MARSQHLLLFQGTEVQSPADTDTDNHQNSSTSGSENLFWPPWTPATPVVHRHAGKPLAARRKVHKIITTRKEKWCYPKCQSWLSSYRSPFASEFLLRRKQWQPEFSWLAVEGGSIPWPGNLHSLIMSNKCWLPQEMQALPVLERSQMLVSVSQSGVGG